MLLVGTVTPAVARRRGFRRRLRLTPGRGEEHSAPVMVKAQPVRSAPRGTSAASVLAAASAGIRGTGARAAVAVQLTHARRRHGGVVAREEAVRRGGRHVGGVVRRGVVARRTGQPPVAVVMVVVVEEVVRRRRDPEPVVQGGIEGALVVHLVVERVGLVEEVPVVVPRMVVMRRHAVVETVVRVRDGGGRGCRSRRIHRGGVGRGGRSHGGGGGDGNGCRGSAPRARAPAAHGSFHSARQVFRRGGVAPGLAGRAPAFPLGPAVGEEVPQLVLVLPADPLGPGCRLLGGGGDGLRGRWEERRGGRCRRRGDGRGRAGGAGWQAGGLVVGEVAARQSRVQVTHFEVHRPLAHEVPAFFFPVDRQKRLVRSLKHTDS